MIARTVAAGVPFGWVAGDTVYGNVIGQKSCSVTAVAGRGGHTMCAGGEE